MLDLALSRRRRQSRIEAGSFTRRHFSSFWPTTTTVASKYLSLEALAELRGKPPLVQQFCRQTSLQAFDDVLANDWQKFEGTIQ